MSTIGNQRISFDPTDDSAASRIKTVTLRLIDMIDDIDAEQAATPGRCKEIERLKALAMTHAENAALWAVDAVKKLAL